MTNSSLPPDNKPAKHYSQLSQSEKIKLIQKAFSSGIMIDGIKSYKGINALNDAIDMASISFVYEHMETKERYVLHVHKTKHVFLVQNLDYSHVWHVWFY